MAWSAIYPLPVFSMSVFVILSPEKKPTPSATMANIAINLARLDFISRSVLFLRAFTSRVSPYHSISSTGAGAGFVSTDSTVPFFMRMTLSAMAHSAEL